LIAKGAIVRGSVIGRRAVIGESACVEDLCVIGDGEVVPPGAKLSGARDPDVTA
jgi:carbonic anhydrase/acetyltransferase-like protein (isoleucine patch superfamily)